MLNLISNLSPLGALSDTLAPQPILGHVEELWTPKAQIPGLPPHLSPEGDRALMLRCHTAGPRRGFPWRVGGPPCSSQRSPIPTAYSDTGSVTLCFAYSRRSYGPCYTRTHCARTSGNCDALPRLWCTRHKTCRQGAGGTPAIFLSCWTPRSKREKQECGITRTPRAEH